jgi:hypothetical protein
MKGQLLFEAIIALALFGLIAAVLVSMAAGGLSSLTQGGDYTQAAALADEGIEAARSVRDGAWNELRYPTTQAVPAGTQWTLNDTANSEVIGKFSRTLLIDSVCRDGSHTIQNCPSLYTDPHSKKITSRVSWTVRAGITNTVERIAYSTNWDSRDMTTNTKAVFDAGNFNATESRPTNDVIVKMFNNWAAARVHSTIQLADTSNANDIFVDEYSDILYFVTDTRAGAGEFFAYDISNISNASPVLLGSVELGVNVDAIWADSRGYIYVGTGVDNSEIKVIKYQGAGSGYQVVGTWSTPGATGNVNDLYGSSDGSKLVVVTSNDATAGANEVFIMNIADPLSIPTSPLFQYEVSDNANAVTVSGDYAYIATNSNNQDLIFLQMSPFIVDSRDVPGGSDAHDLSVSNDTLYISKSASSESELFSYNISDPANPIAGPTAEISDDVLSVFVYDGFAYLATNNSTGELRVVNVSTPTFSVIGGGDANGSQQCNRVWFYSAYAYLACNNDVDELQIFRGGPSGWQAPISKGSGNTTGTLNGLSVAVSGDYAYIGTQNNSSGPEFYSFLINPDGSGSLADSQEIGADINSIYINGDRAYLATSGDAKELEIINIANPADLPSYLSSLGVYNADESFDGLSVYAVGTTVYLGTANNSGSGGACNDDEFYVLNALNPASITCSGSYDVTSNVSSVVVSGSYAYLATPQNAAEIKVLDVSSPGSITSPPNSDVNASGGGDGLSLALYGNYLLLGRSDGGSEPDFHIYDISGSFASNPDQKAAIDTAGDNSGIAIKPDSYVFVSRPASTGSMKVFDISTINLPVEIGSFDSGSQARGVAYSDNLDLAFLATIDNSKELQIVGPTPLITLLAKRGTYTSQVFDSGTARALQVLEWIQDLTACPVSCAIKTLFRSAATASNIPYADWVGPDGTDNDHGDYFTDWRGALISPDQNNKKYFQWKSIFTGDGNNSPLLKEVRVNVK